MVSVPIRGLFNLTKTERPINNQYALHTVSVPIRGLFNLTLPKALAEDFGDDFEFPSPSGDYLI